MISRATLEPVLFRERNETRAKNITSGLCLGNVKRSLPLRETADSGRGRLRVAGNRGGVDMNLWKGLLKQIAGPRESFAEGRERKGSRIGRLPPRHPSRRKLQERRRGWRIFDGDVIGTSSTCFDWSIDRSHGDLFPRAIRKFRIARV